VLPLHPPGPSSDAGTIHGSSHLIHPAHRGAGPKSITDTTRCRTAPDPFFRHPGQGTRAMVDGSSLLLDLDGVVVESVQRLGDGTRWCRYRRPRSGSGSALSAGSARPDPWAGCAPKGQPHGKAGQIKPHANLSIARKGLQRFLRATAVLLAHCQTPLGAGGVLGAASSTSLIPRLNEA
jgi:hypothetical protein